MKLTTKKSILLLRINSIYCKCNVCVFVVCTIYISIENATAAHALQLPPINVLYCHLAYPTAYTNLYLLKVGIRRIATTFHSVIKKFFTENNYTATLFNFDYVLYTNMCVSVRILTLFILLYTHT